MHQGSKVQMIFAEKEKIAEKEKKCLWKEGTEEQQR